MQEVLRDKNRVGQSEKFSFKPRVLRLGLMSLRENSKSYCGRIKKKSTYKTKHWQNLKLTQAPGNKINHNHVFQAMLVVRHELSAGGRRRKKYDLKFVWVKPRKSVVTASRTVSAKT